MRRLLAALLAALIALGPAIAFAGGSTAPGIPYVAPGSNNNVLTSNGLGWVSAPPGGTAVAAFTCIIDGGGSAISSSAASYCVLPIPFACTVVSATITADQSGSIVADIWVTAFSNGVPTSNASSIAASDLPTLSSAQTHQDTTLTGWTTAIAANSLMLFHVNAGASTVQRVTVSLGCSVTL